MNNKIEQNKPQYNLDRQTANISALSWRNVSKHGFLTGTNVLPEKDLPERADTMKRFEYSPLGKELKAQTGIAKKEFQGLDKAFISNKDNKNENESLIEKEKKKYNKSNLIYNKLNFYIYGDDKKLIAFLLNQNNHIY